MDCSFGPTKALSDSKGKLPTSQGLSSVTVDPSSDPSPLQHPLHCLSFLTLSLPAVLYTPAGQTLFPSPLSGSTPEGSLSSFTWRIHPLNHNSSKSLQRYLLTGPAWEPGRILCLSCCTLTHHSFFWVPPLFLRDFKIFRGKKSIKIIFIGNTQLSYFIPQKLHLMR